MRYCECETKIPWLECESVFMTSIDQPHISWQFQPVLVLSWWHVTWNLLCPSPVSYANHETRHCRSCVTIPAPVVVKVPQKIPLSSVSPPSDLHLGASSEFSDFAVFQASHHQNRSSAAWVLLEPWNRRLRPGIPRGGSCLSEIHHLWWGGINHIWLEGCSLSDKAVD